MSKEKEAVFDEMNLTYKMPFRIIRPVQRRLLTLINSIRWRY
jgi:hypothetical protein